MATGIDPGNFVAAVTPALKRNDLQGLHDLLVEKWTAEQIIALLASPHQDARKVAALCLSLVGCPQCLKPIAEQLKDPDPMVNQMAEHAMWCIWMRGGTKEANHQVCRGVQAIERKDFPHAIEHFDRAIQICPTFSEAYNQRAIAKFLMEDFRPSIDDCRKTVELMPIHFGAWAGMGHCHAHLGEFEEAVETYEKALSINPHLTCVQQTIHELKRRIK
jgi:tetratricopeptide (TPR) repeat protein